VDLWTSPLARASRLSAERAHLWTTIGHVPEITGHVRRNTQLILNTLFWREALLPPWQLGGRFIDSHPPAGNLSLKRLTSMWFGRAMKRTFARLNN
jgi:hypothetical protein